MKLICEDIKEMLVQITKGHLDQGKLTVDDLDAKLGRTAATLKWQYGKALGPEGEKEETKLSNNSDLVSFS
jgi:hypothetical protein